MLIKVSELDLFFMSYNEPNAATNWADVAAKVPWAQHVKGIKGFDAVHRYCAALATTPWFVTVDADTVMDPKFLELVLEVPEQGPMSFCWASRNVVNGLKYGNGGLKVWHKPFAENMAFHEFGNGVDFCWDDNYRSMDTVYSDVVINSSPLQAFRAGYREGVKLTLDNGHWIKPALWRERISEFSLRNLVIWCSIGSDVKNGVWAIAGARAGALANAQRAVSSQEVSDFEFIETKFNAIEDPHAYALALEPALSAHTPLSFPFFSPQQSSFIKSYYE